MVFAYKRLESDYDGYVIPGQESTNGANRKFRGREGQAVRQTKALGWRSWWLFVILFCSRKKYREKNLIKI